MLEIRRQFIDKSGRVDLATTTTTENDTDNGADFYINAAVEALDLEHEAEVEPAWFTKALLPGAYEVLLQGSRYIESVWVVDVEGNEEELELHSYKALKGKYPKMGGTDVGQSSYYAVLPGNLPPSQALTGWQNQCKIVLMPPTIEAITVKVYGKFYSKALTTNTADNFWSVSHPAILIMQALKELEGFYRNMQGVKDFQTVLAPKLFGLDKDLAAWSTAGELEMEG